MLQNNIRPYIRAEFEPEFIKTSLYKQLSIDFDVARMIELDIKYSQFTSTEIEEYIRKELYNLPIELIVFDVDVTRLNSIMDGNIRIVCHKIT